MNAGRTKLTEPFSYRLITEHCSQQISQFMAEAVRHKDDEARYRRERAYGVYIGWRALVAERTPHDIFYSDDRRLEQLLVSDKN